MSLYEPYTVLYKTNKNYKRFILDEHTVSFKFQPTDSTNMLEHIVERVLKYFKYKFNPAPWETVGIVIKATNLPTSIWIGLRTSDKLTEKVIIDQMIHSLGSVEGALKFLLDNTIDITFAHVSMLNPPDLYDIKIE